MLIILEERYNNINNDWYQSINLKLHVKMCHL